MSEKKYPENKPSMHKTILFLPSLHTKVKSTERRIRETIDYIKDTRRIVYGKV